MIKLLKSHTIYFYSISLALFTLISVSCSSTSKAISNNSVNNSKELGTYNIDMSNTSQKITIMGGDMERSQYFLQRAANPLEIASWCFKDIPFNTCRVSYDKQQELVEGEKNMAFYDDAVSSMKLLKKVNPNIAFWATMKSDYNGYNHSNNLPDWICDYKPTTRFDCEKYAYFLADYLQYMESNGVPITYLSVSKEWVGVITAERTEKIILVLDNECKKRGIKIPLHVDPASWGISQGVSFIKKIAENGSSDLFYGFCTHNLNKNESSRMLYDNFVKQASAINKPAFADESSTGGGGRSYGKEPETMNKILKAYTEKCKFYKDGIQGELMFEIFSRGVKAESRAVYFTKGSEGHRMRAYYVMKEFASFFKGADKYYIRTDDMDKTNVSSMTFANKDEAMVCIVNSSSSDLKDFSIKIENSTIDGQISKHEFTIDESIEGIASNVSISKNVFTTTIPASSIVFLKMSFK